jgi:hypothetical protein
METTKGGRSRISIKKLKKEGEETMHKEHNKSVANV